MHNLRSRDKLQAMTEPHDLPKGIGAPQPRALVPPGTPRSINRLEPDTAKLAALHGVDPSTTMATRQTERHTYSSPLMGRITRCTQTLLAGRSYGRGTSPLTNASEVTSHFRLPRTANLQGSTTTPSRVSCP